MAGNTQYLLTEPAYACYTAPRCGGVAQLGERDNRTVEARSSSLLTSTIDINGPIGPPGAVAQLGERNTGSVEVEGSNPSSSTTFLNLW